MKDLNLNNNEEIRYISNKIWKSIEILKGILPTEHLHVSLFLLSAYYDEVIQNPRYNNPEAIYNYLFDALNNDPRYSKILRIYAPIIQNIPPHKLEELLHYFSMFYYDIDNYDFEVIFDDLLYRLADAQGKYSGEFILPVEISKFVMTLADLPRHATIFNPFAGLASFGSYLSPNQKYYGQEINNATWALGMLRLIRMHQDHNINYAQDDSIFNWPVEGNFDLVVSNPPFGFKIDRSVSHYEFGERSMTAEQFVIDKGLNNINVDGQVICIASHGILFRGGSEGRMRRRLVEEGFIDTIVSLPAGLLRHTGIPICILILKRNRFQNNTVRLIDASDFSIDENSRNKKLDYKRLLDQIEGKNESEHIRYVSIDEIRDADYNLNVKRYFLEEFPGTILKDFAEPALGTRVQRGELGKFVRIRNLKDDRIDHLLNVRQLEVKELPGHARRIEESCILIAARWKTLKPTYFEYQGDPIHITNDIIPIRLDSNHVDPHYFINELHSEAVTKQADSFRVLGVIPHLKKDDFFNIKIQLPSIDEQRGKVEGFKELSERLKALQRERNALAHGRSVSSFDEFASLKHSLGAPRQNILSNAKSLLRFFELNTSDAFNQVKQEFKDRYNVDLLETFKQIRDDINHISSILEKGEGGLQLDNYPITPLSLDKINEILNNYTNNSYKFKITKHLLDGESIAKKAISGNSTLFKILVDNILTNAHKYGFSEKIPANEVVFDATVIDDTLEIVIKNNGIPFPKNYNKEKFIAKFNTSSNNGTGLGGYDINRIANYFGDTNWQLLLSDDDLYPVAFKFNFPIIPLENE